MNMCDVVLCHAIHVWGQDEDGGEVGEEERRGEERPGREGGRVDESGVAEHVSCHTHNNVEEIQDASTNLPGDEDDMRGARLIFFSRRIFGITTKPQE